MAEWTSRRGRRH